MTDLNEEMKALADFAIKSAKDRYGYDFNYSDESISALEKILYNIYWGFSGFTSEQKKGGLVLEAANIWGSYLGEYMRAKWGGDWIQKGSDKLIIISNVEFSPINLVYQRITSDPDCTIDGYLREIQRITYRLAINPQDTLYFPDNTSQYIQQITIPKERKPFKADKRLLYLLSGVGGVSLIAVLLVLGSMVINSGGFLGFTLFARSTSTNTIAPIEIVINTATPTPTETPKPTHTPSPTSTPTQTRTPTLRPTDTPSPTYTQTPTVTDTPTSTVTQIRRRSPTPTRTQPSQTQIPPTAPPVATATQVPPPTAPPPIVIESCEVNPSTVQAGFSEGLTFTIRFSAPGYGFDATLDPIYPLASGCSGSDDNGDGIAECGGESGMLPGSSTVDVTFHTSLGLCRASYSAP